MRELSALQVDVLRELIAINTVNPPGGESAAADYLGGVLAAWGFTVREQPIAPGRSNLIAEWGDADGPTVALCGHLDVVAADASQWRSDPFALTERGSRLYGRGATDMKGAISAMVAAAKDFTQSGAAARGRLMLLFVCDEEIGSTGSLRFVRENAHPDAVIIGEPTEMDVCVAHRGVLRYQLDIAGRSGHAAEPQNAHNPLLIASRYALLVDRYNREVLSRRQHPILPPPTAAVTMMAGGEQPNSIPGRCRITVDRRTLPGEDPEFLRGEVAQLRAQLPPGDADCIPAPQFVAHLDASEPLPGSTLADDCLSVLCGMGMDKKATYFPASCDQYAYNQAGIDCLLVGPGSIAQAHTADEYIERSELALAKEFYLKFVQSKLTRG